jgi:hypothetical protein
MKLIGLTGSFRSRNSADRRDFITLVAAIDLNRPGGSGEPPLPFWSRLDKAARDCVAPPPNTRAVDTLFDSEVE